MVKMKSLYNVYFVHIINRYIYICVSVFQQGGHVQES